MSLQSKRGFTLLETLIAITVFLTVSTASIYVLHNDLKNKRQAENYSVAVFLASEGIEYVRYLRDTNHLAYLDQLNRGVPVTSYWTKGIDEDCVHYGAECEFEGFTSASQPSITECLAGSIILGDGKTGPGSSNCDYLILDPALGYQYSENGEETPFQRILTFQIVANNPDALRVTSKVVWTENGASYQVIARENIFNW